VTEFERAVARVLDALQPGEVVTYGEVASEAGRPGAARAVGAVLAGSDGRYPWWRVVTSTGRLVPGHEREHARLLRGEGVAVRNGRVVGPTGLLTAAPADQLAGVDARAGRRSKSSRSGSARTSR
jgi:methylated-DNA-protein-cysteine methyltransferase related protein